MDKNEIKKLIAELFGGYKEYNVMPAGGVGGIVSRNDLRFIDAPTEVRKLKALIGIGTGSNYNAFEVFWVSLEPDFPFKEIYAAISTRPSRQLYKIVLPDHRYESRS